MKLPKLSLQLKIFIGLILGIVYGLLAIYFDISEFTHDWIKPWGTIFIRLLKLIAIPLIFVSLVQGIASMTNISQLSRLGYKTLALYLTTTVIAISVGLFAVGLIKPAQSFPTDRREQLQEMYQDQIGDVITDASVKDKSPLQVLVDIVPENIIGASANNRNMLQVIFFAFLFGISVVMVGREKAASVINFFDATNHVLILMVQLIMKYAPYGVFALLGSMLVELAGDSVSSTLDLLGALGLYALTVMVGLLFLALVVYPLAARFIAKKKYGEFLRAILPAQLVAFTTSSSVATLPVTMAQCENELKLRPSVVSFVLPIGATVNMDGTSLYQAVAAVFIANIFGFDLTFLQQLTIVLTATLASIGSAGVPSAGVIMLVIVLESIGVPAAGVALILAVDRPLDMFRTVINVTGDCLVCAIVDRTENEKFDEGNL
ncbi:MAG: dicarboxylate/amino acid:cation symporter [Salinivirgaceae bacterium]|nr:dicarboxylate/amino acid:cation symporter [Salinivirgaceae bacterium]MDD4747049.1 dicarboxylate/amino acid:cation symporter [Salinivirgaceae bacterium]